MSQEKKLRHLELIRIDQGKEWKPQSDEEARILSGVYTHIAASASYVDLRDERDRVVAYLVSVSASKCTQSFAFNPILPTSEQREEDLTDARNIYFDHKIRLVITGGSGAYANVLLEIVKVDPRTGKRLA